MTQLTKSIHLLHKTFLFYLLIFLAGSSLVHSQEDAATALSVRGFVTASDTNGDVRRLKRGDTIFSGETIETGNRARIRMSFTDGATAVLRADTTYEINDYSFSGQEDGTESASFRLVSGALEMLSGLIGRQNQNSFRLDTPLATIGLRGTEFVVAVYPPATAEGRPTVRVSVAGGAVVYSSPLAPPVQLPQGNSVEQLEDQLPTTSNTITEPFVTITVEGDDIEEALETLFESEVTTDEEAEEAERRNNEIENEDSDESRDEAEDHDNEIENEDSDEPRDEAEDHDNEIENEDSDEPREVEIERAEPSTEDNEDYESSSSVEDELSDDLIENLRESGNLTDEQIRELEEEINRITDQASCPNGQIVSPAGSGQCVPL